MRESAFEVEAERPAWVVTEHLFAAGSWLQPYLEDPNVVNVRADNHRATWITYVDVDGGNAAGNPELIEMIRGLGEEVATR